MSCFSYLCLDRKFQQIRINTYEKELNWKKTKSGRHDSYVDFFGTLKNGALNANPSKSKMDLMERRS
jgi:hypothetical protein